MEGARRIKRLGQAICALGCLAAIAIWIALTIHNQMGGPFEHGVRDSVLNDMLHMLGLFIPPLFLGGALWATGWILEGFLRPSPRNENAAGPQPIARAGFRH
jgi:hypothetical protein